MYVCECVCARTCCVIQDSSRYFSFRNTFSEISGYKTGRYSLMLLLLILLFSFPFFSYL